VELQKRSSRRSKHSSRRRERSSADWEPIQFARIVGIVLVAVGPWWYGSAPWVAQFWMVIATILLALILVCEFGKQYVAAKSTQFLSIPSLSFLFLGLAAFSWLQAFPAFSIEGGGWAPKSVQLQRWFLGQPDAQLDQRFGATSNAPLFDAAISDSNGPRRDTKLALSVEPLHSRAAIGALATIAVMIWLGSAGFRSQNWQIGLLIFVTCLGVAMGLIGLANALAWEKTNWLGLDGSRSFATFVSKNTAGGFLNICLSTSLGLAAWAFTRPNQKDHRYAYQDESPAVSILRVVEDVFAQLTTAQIATMLSTAFILTCVFCSGSRGASISAVLACLVALLLGSGKRHGAGRWVFAAVVVAIGLSVIFYFEYDQRLTTNFWKLASTDTLEDDLQAGRTYIWGIAIKSCSFYGLLGSGLGTFHYSHLPFQDTISEGWYYHAESLYFQALVDLGLLGLVGLIAGVVMMIRDLRVLNAETPKAISRLRGATQDYAPAYIVGLTLLVSQSIHSIVDFALIVPAVFLPAALLVGMIRGVAIQRKLDESQPIAIPESESRRGSRSSRLPKVESSRFKSRDDESKPSPVLLQRTWTKENSVLALGSVVAILILFSSVQPLNAMSRVDLMKEWLNEQDRVPQASRGGSPSEYLAGLWGRPWFSIAQVPDALRTIGESVLYEFRLERLETLESTDKSSAPVVWEMTSPLLTRLAIQEQEVAFLAKQNREADFEKSSDFLKLIGGDKQLKRWDKARELIERAHVQSPLDWRLAWGRLLLDRHVNVGEWNGWYDRAAMLSEHRSESMFQLGVLARQAAKDRQHSNALFEKAMQMAPHSNTTRAAALIAMDTPDEEVNTEIFPAIPYLLHVLTNSPFEKAKFPRCNQQLWRQIDDAAKLMNINDPNRFLWLSYSAAYFGRLDDELRNLEEAVYRSPTNKENRLRWADRLAASGDLKTAVQQAEICLSLAPDDPHIEATVKRLQSMELQRNAIK